MKYSSFISVLSLVILWFASGCTGIQANQTAAKAVRLTQSRSDVSIAVLSETELARWGSNAFENPFMAFKPTFGKPRYKVYPVKLSFERDGIGRVEVFNSYLAGEKHGRYLSNEAFREFLEKSVPYTDGAWQEVRDVLDRTVPHDRDFPFRRARVYVLPVVLGPEEPLPDRMELIFIFEGQRMELVLDFP